MSVCRVDRDDVDTGFHQRIGTLQTVARHADRCSDTQAAKLVLAGIGARFELENVLIRDQTDETTFLIDYR